MDQLITVNNIVDNEQEEPRSSTYLKEEVIETDDEKETTLIAKKMHKRRNDEHQWKRTNHTIGYTEVRNRFQWPKHDTSKNWFCAMHSKQSPTMLFKFTTNGTKKPSRQ